MGYLITATARTDMKGGPHSVRTRWRSDDPWGAIWRCLYDAMHPYIPLEIDIRESKEVCQLTLTVRFEPDREDADELAGLFEQKGAYMQKAKKPKGKEFPS